jgi:hypothetical protein
MIEPPRLLDAPETSAMGKQLLQSARDDGPSEPRRAALAATLSLASVTAAKSVASAAAASHLVAWSLAVIVSISAAVIALRSRSHPAPGLPTPAPTQPIGARATRPPAQMDPGPAAINIRPPGRAVTAKGEPSLAVAPARPAAPAPSHRRRPAPAAAIATVELTESVDTAERAASAPATSAAPPEGDLTSTEQARRRAAEVALLDRARDLLAAGEITAANSALDRHAREFSDGVLTTEAEVLAIDGLLRSHHTAQAQLRAAQFLRDHPSSPLARRVRTLLASTIPPAPSPVPETP